MQGIGVVTAAAVQQSLGDAQGAEDKVFISFSRKDMAFADRLEAALKARASSRLIDRSEIYAFEDWWKRIEALIAQARHRRVRAEPRRGVVRTWP